MNPPRPTPAKMRALIKKYDRIIEDINTMARGNTMSADSHKLGELRELRLQAREAQMRLTNIGGKVVAK